ncbi:MAG: tRNA dimethylallyltransferase, partial [Sphingomicrobium sp.]
IAPVPAIDPAIRSEIRAATVADNLARLALADPDSTARLNPADTTRIARALEVALSTGRPLKAWQAQRSGGIAGEVTLRPMLLLPPRDWLYQRCDQRFADMIDAGAVDEVSRLLARDLSPTLPVMRAIGVREIAGFIRGDTNEAEMLAAGQQATRNYAKRQYTWFAHQPPAEWPRFGAPLEGGAIRDALALIAPSD